MDKGAKILTLLFSGLLFLVACSDSTTSQNEVVTGSIQPQINWVSDSGVASKTIDLFGNSLPVDLITVRISVSASNMTTIERSFPAEDRSGTVSGVPVGTGRTLTVYGLNSASRIVYRGVTTNVSVFKGSATPVQVDAVEVIEPIIIKLNDTGITWGGNYPDGNNPGCIGETIAGQDCSTGRDALANEGKLSKTGAGFAGFDFSKLDVNGVELVDQTQDYATNPWVCVRDNHTGLVWETKTSVPGIHHKDNTYRWGGVTALLVNSFGAVYNDWDGLVDASNSELLCGFNDWRVPSREQFRSIVNYNQAVLSIDGNYFPNTVSEAYWSASSGASVSDTAWNINFSDGFSTANNRATTERVRLVRGGELLFAGE